MNYKLENNLMKNPSYIFEKNLGQQYSSAKFILKTEVFTLFFLQDRITIGVMQPLPEDEAKKQRDLFKSPEKKILEKLPKRKTYFINILFENCNSNANIVGEDELQSKFNSFGQNLPKEGVTNINTYSKIRYNNIYPNIDLVFYSNGNLLEHDFIVKPNANPKHIKLLFEGHDELTLDEEGNAIISIKSSQIKLLRPNSYQIINEIKSEVTSKFIVSENSLSIEAKNYDIKKELIIDPVLFYSTYLGGNGETEGSGIAVDTLGSAYVTGFTTSSNFPTTNPIIGMPYDSTYAVFVIKFDTNGDLIYSTYIHGDSDDFAYAIALDNSNNAYITGVTYSSNYPSTKTLADDPDDSGAVFVTKLNSNGDSIVYSAYINGDSAEEALGIAVDNSNNSYITGYTVSSNYPITNSFGVAYNITFAVFITKLNSNGDSIVYSAYINGDDDDTGYGIAVDNSNNFYVTGVTLSSDFPTKHPYDSDLSGDSNAFVLKFITTEDLLGSIYDEITNQDYGLQEIKAEVSTIENTVLDPNYGLQPINKTVLEINYRLKRLDGEVDDLEQKIYSLNAKLNCILELLKSNL